MTIQELGSQSKRRSDDYFDRMNEAEDESDDLNFEYDDEDMTSGTRKPGWSCLSSSIGKLFH